MAEEIKKIIDMMIEEKMGCKEYRELAESQEDEEIKEMLNMIADQEHTHYKMLKEWIMRFMNTEKEE